MAREQRSLQDLIQSRQRSGFVGRQGQVTQFVENLALEVDDEHRDSSKSRMAFSLVKGL